MSITTEDIQMALRIKNCVKEYFEIYSINKILAKELMPHLIKKRIFIKNHKDGLPIRDFLRKLEKENHLHLIPQVHFEQKEVNKNWYFINVS